MRKDSGASGERPDLRLVAPAVATWATALLTLGTSAWIAVCTGLIAVCTGLVAATAAAVSLVPQRAAAWRTVAAAALVCASTTGLSVGLRLAAVSRGQLRDLATQGRDVTLTLTVTGAGPRSQPPKVRGSKRQRYVLVPGRTQSVSTSSGRTRVRSPVLVIATGPGWNRLLPSEHVRIQGELASPRYDPLLAAVVFVRGPPEVVQGPAALQDAAGRIRAGLRAAVRPLPAPERGLLPGLVVGDTSRMTPRVEADFKTSGLAHLTAVSGANWRSSWGRCSA